MDATKLIQSGIAGLIEGKSLTRVEARDIMGAIMLGEASQAQIGSLLTALRIKGETVEEITGFAEAMRGFGTPVLTEKARLLDTCGTGGSGIHKFNISTASAIISSAASVRVAKHGNRSASGRAGSADVLEALGVNIHLNADQARECLDRIGICFYSHKSIILRCGMRQHRVKSLECGRFLICLVRLRIPLVLTVSCWGFMIGIRQRRWLMY